MKTKVDNFVEYFNSFYGINGIYPSDRNIGTVEIMDAIAKMEEMTGELFQGDSHDREVIRNLIFTEDEQNTMYFVSAEQIKLISV